MALSTQRAVSDGTLVTLDLSIRYMKRADISVFFADLPAPEGSWAWVGTTDKRIRFTNPVPNGVEVLLKRTTKIDANQHIYVLGAKFNNVSMDENFTQLLFLTQEAVEGAALTDIFNDVDFHGYKIKNLGVAVDRNDAVSFGQLQDMVPGVWTAKQQAEAARDKAKEWATKPTAVEGTSQSAQTNAERAQGSATTATNASAAAIAARDKSLSHANVSANWAVAADASREAAATSEALAKNWANLPRNQEVTPGEYSALHWSRISQSWAEAAASSVLPDNSVTLQKLTPDVRDNTWLKLAGGTMLSNIHMGRYSTTNDSFYTAYRGGSADGTELIWYVKATTDGWEVRAGANTVAGRAIRVDSNKRLTVYGGLSLAGLLQSSAGATFAGTVSTTGDITAGGTVSAGGKVLATSEAVNTVDDRVTALADKKTSEYVYFGGTEAAPVSLAINTHTRAANPFPGKKVAVRLEFKYAGEWIEPGFYSNNAAAVGAMARYKYSTDEVWAIAGLTGTLPRANLGCNVGGNTGADVTTPLPVRVLVWLI